MVTNNEEQIEALEARAAELMTQMQLAEQNGDEEELDALDAEGEELAFAIEELEEEEY